MRLRGRVWGAHLAEFFEKAMWASFGFARLYTPTKRSCRRSAVMVTSLFSLLLSLPALAVAIHPEDPDAPACVGKPLGTACAIVTLGGATGACTKAACTEWACSYVRSSQCPRVTSDGSGCQPGDTGSEPCEMEGKCYWSNHCSPYTPIGPCIKCAVPSQSTAASTGDSAAANGCSAAGHAPAMLGPIGLLCAGLALLAARRRRHPATARQARKQARGRE